VIISHTYPFPFKLIGDKYMIFVAMDDTDNINTRGTLVGYLEI